MQTKMQTFRAVATDKKVYTVEQWLNPILASYELKTDAGELVQRLDKGKYRIVRSQLDLTTDDPAAP